MNHNVYGYKKGCRCDVCKKAKAVAYKKWKDKDKPLPDKHGISTYNNHRCRCDECRQAWSEYTRNYYAKNKKKREEMSKTPNEYAKEIIKSVAGDDWESVYKDTFSVTVHASANGGEVALEVIDRDENGKRRLDCMRKVVTFNDKS